MRRIEVNQGFTEAQILNIAHAAYKISPIAFLFSSGKHDACNQTILGIYPQEVIEGGWDALDNLNFSKENNDPCWLGFLSYEMAKDADRDKTVDLPVSEWPLSRFCRYGLLLQFKSQENKLTVLIDETCKEAESWCDLLAKKAEEEKATLGLVHATSSDTKETYLEKVNIVKEWILDGEVYELNLSQEMTLVNPPWEKEIDSFSLFKQLVADMAAPFSAFLSWDKNAIISLSPERFLKFENGILETRPIKGTTPKQSDSANAKERLLASTKEDAELMMIVDLSRNDLGKVAERKGVWVKELKRAEEYESLFHLVSLIQAKAKADLTPQQLLRETFPAGSITGCPKLRAVELIQQVEKRPRGIYTGSIGYFTNQGNFDFNVAIRTLTVQDREYKLAYGGAITSDSDPEKEYEETLAKANKVLSFLKPSEVLFTTCKIQEGKTLYLEEHHQKLLSMAEKKGWVIENPIPMNTILPQKGKRRLILKKYPQEKKARLISHVEEEGQLSAYSHQIENEASKIKLLALCKEGYQEKNGAIFLRRKQHQTYLNLGFDDVLFLDRKGRILEAIWSNIYWLYEGYLYTPSPELPLYFGTAIKRLVQAYGDKAIMGSYQLSDIPPKSELYLVSALGQKRIEKIEARENR